MKQIKLLPFISFVIIWVFSNGVLIAQQNQKVPIQLKNRMSINMENVPLSNILEKISKKTNIQLLYSDTFIPKDRIVSVNVNGKPANEVLQQVLAQTSTNFKVTGAGQVVLVPTESQSIGMQETLSLSRITGIILDDATGEPLSGANIMIKGTKLGASTDIDGYFSLEYDSDQEFTIVAQFVGYKSFEQNFSPSDNLSNLRIEMVEDVFNGEAIVVTGIASKTSKAIAEVAVSRVSASDLTEKQSYTGLSQLVNGKMAGVQMSTSSGNVTSGFRFHMRGGGGVNGDEQPIIYIDGVRMENNEIVGIFVGGQGFSTLTGLNVQDIENIDVLKGPAAAAMYGTSGSNGVVLITTKSGKLIPGSEGGAIINYRYNYGINTQLFKYRNEDYYGADIVNDLFNDGYIREHSLNVDGGTELVRYYASYRKRDENGILFNDWVDKTSFRANFSAFPSDKLFVKVNAGYNFYLASRPHSDNSLLGPMSSAILYDIAFKKTPLEDIKAIVDRNKVNEFIGSVNMTWKPISTFEVQADAGVYDTDLRQDQTLPANINYGFVSNGRREIYQRNHRQYTYNINARYRYTLLKDLEVTSIVGTQIFDRITRTQYNQVLNFTPEILMPIQAGEVVRIYTEFVTPERQAGIFTEHAFVYQNKYFLTLGLRKDYASSIGDEAPSITYPKISFATRIDKFDILPKEINMLKLRAAYGEGGTLPKLGDGLKFAWQAKVGGHGTGLIIKTIGNPNIKPERIKEIEVGFDMEFLNNYSLEFTYYNQFASNSIVEITNSPSTGLTASGVPFNIGKLENSGFEILLQLNPIRTSDYDLNMNLIWSYQTNEVTDLGGAPTIISRLNRFQEGYAKHEFIGPKVLGPTFDAVTGVYTGPETSDDVALGNPIPNSTGSFSLNFRFLKNFNFYGMSEWGMGNKIFDLSHRYAANLGGNKRYWELATQIGWEDPAKNANIPDDIAQLTPGTPEYIAAATELASLDPDVRSNFVKDAGYFIFRELSLSYDFSDILKSYKVNRYFSKITVGISVRNLFRYSQFKTGDFEVNFTGSRSLVRGVEFFSLPMPRTYNFFVNFGF